jgi:hypothetical protein
MDATMRLLSPPIRNTFLLPCNHDG